MTRQTLGELEELIMLIVGTLHPDAYAVSIRKALLEKMDRKVTLSSIHTTLNRLEEKQFVSSHFGEATPERGGKRKRYFLVTKEGYQALDQVKASREQLYSQFYKVKFNF